MAPRTKAHEEDGRVQDEAIQEITRRRLEFCVVMPPDTPLEKFRPGASRPALLGISTALDVVPWRQTDFEQRAMWVKASLPATVNREGRVLYDSERAPCQ